MEARSQEPKVKVDPVLVRILADLVEQALKREKEKAA